MAISRIAKNRIVAIFYSIKAIFVVNLGDYVTYEGKRYLVINGVRPKSWRLSGLYNNDDGWVKRLDCKKVFSFRNCINSYKTRYNFYRVNWFSIWDNKGIEPWVKTLNIWGKK